MQVVDVLWFKLVPDEAANLYQPLIEDAKSVDVALAPQPAAEQPLSQPEADPQLKVDDKPVTRLH